MIRRSTEHMVCEHSDGRRWKVVFAGNKRDAQRARKAYKKLYPDRVYCTAFSVDHHVGDFMNLHNPRG